MRVVTRFNQIVGIARVQGIFELLAKRVEKEDVTRGVNLVNSDRALAIVKGFTKSNDKHTVIIDDSRNDLGYYGFIRAEADLEGKAEVISISALPIDGQPDKRELIIRINADTTYRNIWNRVVPILREIKVDVDRFEIIDFEGSVGRRNSGLWYLPKERYLLEIASKSEDGFIDAVDAVVIIVTNTLLDIEMPLWAAEFNKLIDCGVQEGSKTCLALHQYLVTIKDAFSKAYGIADEELNKAIKAAGY